ncbi:MAG: DUF4159 domain-containing protein [Cyanobacteria bacterium J06592_8]
MTDQSFPTPSPNPLDRLHVTDGLMINAQRWRLAHTYSRRRQNLHYQSLNQPGIVCGLGVHPTEAPAGVQSKFKTGWLKVKPGIAIDGEGNPIIIDRPMEFRITDPKPSKTEPIIVYLVASYVDPEELSLRNDHDVVRETFRLDQKTDPPSHLEVEICRINLQPGIVEICQPEDTLFPQVNDVDLRYRIPARSRPHIIMKAAMLSPQASQGMMSEAEGKYCQENLTFLMQSVESLDPRMQGISEIEQIHLEGYDTFDFDLLYLTEQQTRKLGDNQLEILGGYLKQGGTILIEIAIDDDLNQNFKELTDWAKEEFNLNFIDWDRLIPDHLLKVHPFLFAIPPNINYEPIDLILGGGIILIIGSLSKAWGINQHTLPRTEIRTAQEFGINLLYFAWYRRHQAQLLEVALE